MPFFSGELKTVYHQIFGQNSTVDDKRNAYQTLQTWKVRRSQETMTGVLCTLTLLDIHLKDAAGTITDRSTLSTLYASTLTKFINYATSYQVGETSMYRSAKKLGIESFLIDLRHMCAHGKQLPSLEVFRKSHRTCLNWIKQFFWDQELTNICDATSKDFRFDSELADKAKSLLQFYDTLAQLLQKNIVRLEDVPVNGTVQQRWPTINKFMQQNKLKDFQQAIKYLTANLTVIVESRAMSLNPRTFFHEMFEHCEFFMQTTDICDADLSNASLEEEEDDSEVEEVRTKRKKSEPPSVVQLYQPLIWQIAKHDHLKLFLDMLYQISLNDGENAIRRTSARFWIVIVVKSFKYYQLYSRFSKKNVILEKKINLEVRKIYSYQLDADLRKVKFYSIISNLQKSDCDFRCLFSWELSLCLHH